MKLSLSPHLACCNPTLSAQPRKAVARASPPNLSGGASRIRLFSASKGRLSMEDAPEFRPLALFPSLPRTTELLPGSACDQHRCVLRGRIEEVKRVTKLARKNSHHIIEATFKAFARALKQATEYDLRCQGTIPAQKGCHHILDEDNPFIELKLDLGSP